MARQTQRSMPFIPPRTNFTAQFEIKEQWVAIRGGGYTDPVMYVLLPCYQSDQVYDPADWRTGGRYCDLNLRVVIMPNGQHIQLSRCGGGPKYDHTGKIVRGSDWAPDHISGTYGELTTRMQICEFANYAMGKPLDAPNSWGWVRRNPAYKRFRYGRRYA